MRSERAIVDSVLALAAGDDGVRAVVRTDLLPVREYLHSFNFIFVVRDVGRYDGDVFRDSLGERILLFRADRSYPELFPGAKAHLMVFGDGATIVITAFPFGEGGDSTNPRQLSIYPSGQKPSVDDIAPKGNGRGTASTVTQHRPIPRR